MSAQKKPLGQSNEYCAKISNFNVVAFCEHWNTISRTCSFYGEFLDMKTTVAIISVPIKCPQCRHIIHD